MLADHEHHGHLPGSFLHGAVHSGGYSHNPYKRLREVSPESIALKKPKSGQGIDTCLTDD